MEKRFFLRQGSLQIPCILTVPEQAQPQQVVLGVHGLGGSARDTIQTGIAQEMDIFCNATVRFDFPGHGESPMDGSSFTLENCRASLLAAARYAKEQFPETGDLCIFATGFGAYVTLLCLEQLLSLPGSIRLVIQTPSVCMDETLLSMIGRSRQTLWAMEKITLPTPRPLEITYSFYESLRQNSAMGIYSIPMLILQGEEDSYIRMSDIQHVHRINEQSKLVILPGVSHRFAEEGAWDMVLDLTRDWFEFQQVFLTDWI